MVKFTCTVVPCSHTAVRLGDHDQAAAQLRQGKS